MPADEGSADERLDDERSTDERLGDGRSADERLGGTVPEHHRASLHATFGPAQLRRLAGGDEAEVWLVRGPTRRAILKLWNDRRQREADAYRELAPALSPWMLTPLATWPGALLLPWVPGSVAPTSPQAHHWAGQVLARLERLTVSATIDPLSVPEALARRFEAWWRRGHPWLPPGLQATMERGLLLARFEGWPRCACHRDFEPRNWMHDGTTFVALDWGQARTDVRGWDRIKLREGLWRERPALARAFDEGYGREVALPEGELDQLAQLHGLQTYVWGHLHGSPAYIEQGRTILSQYLPNAAL